MNRYADLEITVRALTGNSCSAGFRYNSPNDDAEQRSLTEPVFILDSTSLNTADPTAYAAALSTAFFTPELVGEFRRFRTAAAGQSFILRVRLTVDPASPQLHAIRWETLRDPDLPAASPGPLFIGEQTILSRFLSSGDSRPIRRQPKGSLKALVAVANPASTAKYHLAPVDVPGELAAASQALAGIEIVTLAPGGPLVLNDLASKLREGFDILYLVCHGKLVDTTSYLFLDETPCQGDELVQAIQGLDRRPLLILLASCQSAGQSGVGMAALGPSLAEAGVAAVIAMQGNIFMETARPFVARFFTELRVDGQVDRAVSVARGDVRHADDYWMPAVFMRLRDGSIWYEPGFGDDDSFDKWPALCQAVQKGSFVPILGPELGENYFGPSAELAATLAQNNGFPLADHDRTDLARVSQYISVNQDSSVASSAAQSELARRLAVSIGGDATQPLSALCAKAASVCCADPTNPYRILSDLRAPIYINASYEPMLFSVLKAQGRNPETVFIPWRGSGTPQKPQPSSPVPSSDAPWVYHAFGLFDQSDDMVLTEDDFFDYLIVTSRLQLQPDALTGKINRSSLLFLGFRLDDWRFRVLFRMIATSEGAAAMQRLTHIGVQINPGEQEVADVNKAQKYLQSYFATCGFSPKFSVYWGSPADFLKDLQAQLNKLAPAAPVPAPVPPTVAPSVTPVAAVPTSVVPTASTLTSAAPAVASAAPTIFEAMPAVTPAAPPTAAGGSSGTQ
jgi:CHAT domain/SIR2-like domain